MKTWKWKIRLVLNEVNLNRRWLMYRWRLLIYARWKALLWLLPGYEKWFRYRRERSTWIADQLWRLEEDDNRNIPINDAYCWRHSPGGWMCATCQKESESHT